MDIQDTIDHMQKTFFPLADPIGSLEYDRHIVLAARAKAAMARRGYAFIVSPVDVCVYWLMAVGSSDQRILATSQLDDTDAVSEARAVLRCVYAVLLSNPKDQRAGEAGSGASNCWVHSANVDNI
jgi:hypothetical protein